ncbi:probable ATP-dependent RNA helicase DHX37 [Octopus vulgaris]|uniref:RNA helicase n=1 Tax=Octopus vulgaris TaxID=6645 RepID=A0AA36C2M4_OCTVU|nr:probable ATP-dependent RNA helicase DHX37 [Octopus vulgaris]
MGRLRRRYNQKGRQQLEIAINKTEQEKIQLDLPAQSQQTSYDDSNALVLPSEKRKTKKIAAKKETKVVISKKLRKKLLKIVEKKKRKIKRSDLIAALASVQASSSEIDILKHCNKKKAKTKQKPDRGGSTDGAPSDVRSGSDPKGQQKLKEEEEEENEEEEEEDEKEEEENESESEHSVCNSDEEDGEEEESDAEKTPLETSKGLGEADGNKKRKNNPDPEKNVEDSGDSKDMKRQKISEDGSIDSEAKTEQGVQQNGVSAKTSAAMKPRKVVFIPVDRKPEMQESRLKLPILSEEQQVMEAIHENPVVLVVGDTGSGKTTQVPQFLYEAGYAHNGGIIGITEPRRVAAISMSNRVASEMNLSSEVVSYQIRYEGNTTPKTKLKFMTDGVLFKEIQQDFLLSKYSVIILDEAHERTVYTDILIGLLSRVVPVRQKRKNPLRLIVMSATLRLNDFIENHRLFKVTPPVIKIDSRQFPVTIHFNKHTPVDNYLVDVYRKACKIHLELPEGGILIFVTSQQEVRTLCHYLKHRFPYNSGKTEKPLKPKFLQRKKQKNSKNEKLPDISLNNYSIYPEKKEVGLVEDNEGDVDLSDGFAEVDDDDVMADISTEPDLGSVAVEPLYVLPMYSLLPGHKQARVFLPPPKNCRLCVVSTNVAETSITIPDIKYVVDSGKVKTKYCDKVTGASIFKVTWTSKASASQRAGRAGRVGPGHCYRLYSSAVYNDDFIDYSEPEILRRPLEDIILQMRFLGIDKVLNFPYPTSPDKKQIIAAEKLLTILGALTKPKTPKTFKEIKKLPPGELTSIGKSMAKLPISPRYAKMLVLAQQHHLMPYVIAMVSGLTVQELFLPVPKTVKDASDSSQKQQNFAANARLLWSGTGHSQMLGDPMLLLKSIGACEFDGNIEVFCEKFSVRLKAMREIRKLRLQLTNTVNLAVPGLQLCIDPKMSPPTDAHAKLLRQILLAGMADHVARRIDSLPEDWPAEKKKQMKYAYETLDSNEPVWIHPESILHKKRPQYVVYQFVHETAKPYMKIVAGVEAQWFPLILPNLCQFSKPEESPAPRFDPKAGKVFCHMSGTFGPKCWPFDILELEFPKGSDLYKWFGRFFLEGEVCPALKKFVPHMKDPPCVMVKYWSRLKPETEKLVRCLLAADVDDKKSLTDEWSKNKTYLLAEYLKWLPEEQHAAVKELWPPV